VKSNCISLFILFIALLFSETYIPGGGVSGTWTYENSPYYINGDIFIPSTHILEIESGIDVLFTDNYELDVRGIILAEGSVDSLIVFSRYQTIGWNGIWFHNTNTNNDSSKFVYCEIKYCVDAPWWDGTYGGAFNISNFSKILISNCIIKNNTVSGFGGGLYCYNSDLIIENTVFKDNTATGYWGDDWYDPGNGGAIYCSNSSPRIINCSFKDNYAEQDGAYSRGGGILFENSSPIIFNSIITNNNSGWGGGIYSYNSLLTITNSIISNNFSSFGGGIYEHNSTNVIFVNSILWYNYPDEVYFNNYSQPNSISVLYSNIQDGEAGIITNNDGEINWYEGNLDSDPLFLDPENDNYQFLSNSPCINTGTPDTTGLNLPEYDLAGNPRIYDGRIDMGCYEWQGTEINEELIIDNERINISNFPNPFNLNTTISFSISKKDKNKPVTLNIYNIKGQRINQLRIKNYELGMNKIIWNGKDDLEKPVSSGIYFYQLNIDKKPVATKKCLLLK